MVRIAWGADNEKTEGRSSIKKEDKSRIFLDLRGFFRDKPNPIRRKGKRNPVRKKRQKMRPSDLERIRCSLTSRRRIFVMF